MKEEIRRIMKKQSLFGKFVATGIIGITFFLILFGIAIFLNERSLNPALDEFFTQETKESYLVLSLCNAGEQVVPFVAEAIKDKNMKRRAYAIIFLGSGNYRQAIPSLVQIVEDSSEKGYRDNALESLYLIDEKLGKSFAEQYQSEPNDLGEQSKTILQIDDYQSYKNNKQKEICFPTD